MAGVRGVAIVNVAGVRGLAIVNVAGVRGVAITRWLLPAHVMLH